MPLAVKRCDPFWLHGLSKEEREEVVEWIEYHGVDSNICANFDITFEEPKSQVRCKIYKTQDGTPILNRDTMEPEWDQDQVFETHWLPPAIEREHPARRRLYERH